MRQTKNIYNWDNYKLKIYWRIDKCNDNGYKKLERDHTETTNRRKNIE